LQVIDSTCNHPSGFCRMLVLVRNANAFPSWAYKLGAGAANALAYFSPIRCIPSAGLRDRQNWRAMSLRTAFSLRLPPAIINRMNGTGTAAPTRLIRNSFRRASMPGDAHQPNKPPFCPRLKSISAR
jgi:predicted NBD/HSP70 family sugar kinase